MTDKELIQAFRICNSHEVCPECPVHGKWFDCFFMEQNKHTTHWMSLPEPPSTEGVE